MYRLPFFWMITALGVLTINVPFLTEGSVGSKLAAVVAPA